MVMSSVVSILVDRALETLGLTDLDDVAKPTVWRQATRSDRHDYKLMIFVPVLVVLGREVIISLREWVWFNQMEMQEGNNVLRPL